MKYFLLLFALTTTSFANDYSYNCLLSLKDNSGVTLGSQIISLDGNKETVTPNPPGNAACLIVKESQSTGVVAAYDGVVPDASQALPRNLATLTVTLFRRVGFDGDGTGSIIEQIGPSNCESIPYISQDSVLGTISANGSQDTSQQMGTYLVDLSCQQP